MGSGKRLSVSPSDPPSSAAADGSSTQSQLPGVGRQPEDISGAGVLASEDDARLFGIPGAEQLHRTLADCYESDIDPWVDEQENGPKVIEEWTCAPVASHLPAADWLIDNLLSWVADEGLLDEHGYDAFENACGGDDVKEAAEKLRAVIASKVNYRMAESLVAEHAVTWNADREPMVDGAPLYIKEDDRGF